MRNKILFGALTFLVALAAAFAFLILNGTPPEVVGPEETAATVTPAPSVPALSETPPRTGEAENLDIGQATFRVGGETYVVDVTPRATVLHAMNQLVAEGSLTYTSREYPGLGLFVDSINGIENANGMYWILHVNGSPASVGAGALEIHKGDVIEWNYEKEY